jgi:hypothetical protein
MPGVGDKQRLYGNLEGQRGLIEVFRLIVSVPDT